MSTAVQEFERAEKRAAAGSTIDLHGRHLLALKDFSKFPGPWPATRASSKSPIYPKPAKLVPPLFSYQEEILCLLDLAAELQAASAAVAW